MLSQALPHDVIGEIRPVDDAHHLRAIHDGRLLEMMLGERARHRSHVVSHVHADDIASRDLLDGSRERLFHCLAEISVLALDDERPSSLESRNLIGEGLHDIAV